MQAGEPVARGSGGTDLERESHLIKFTRDSSDARPAFVLGFLISLSRVWRM